MSFIKNFKQRSGIFGEFISFLWKNKLWWIIPIVVVLIAFIVLVIFTESTPIAPFIYTLF
jgi:cytochrome c-type biogenesis protein CcmH/NrfF